MKITLKQLGVFIAIAKCENMTQAANAVFLTQSACSMALAALEEQLGEPLFDRHGKKLILNDRGRFLFPKAVNILAELKEFQDLGQQQNPKNLLGQLKVGASTTIGNYSLPKIIGNFVTQHTQTKINLDIANTAQVIQKLLKFEIDIGLVEGQCYAEEIQVTPWKKDKLIFIAAANHPLAKKRHINLEQLAQANWIVREPGSGTRETIERALPFKLHALLELGNTESIKQAVLTGIGISCLSEIAVTDLLKSGQLVSLKTPLNLVREFIILVHKDKYHTALLENFMKVCINTPLSS